MCMCASAKLASDNVMGCSTGECSRELQYEVLWGGAGRDKEAQLPVGPWHAGKRKGSSGVAIDEHNVLLDQWGGETTFDKRRWGCDCQILSVNIGMLVVGWQCEEVTGAAVPDCKV